MRTGPAVTRHVGLPSLAASVETLPTVAARCLARGGLEVGAPYGICSVVQLEGGSCTSCIASRQTLEKFRAQVTLDSETSLTADPREPKPQKRPPPCVDVLGLDEA